MSLTSCSECGHEISTKAQACPNCGVPLERLATYYPVSPYKFVILSILTFGVYEVYWFYRNWTFVRERDRSDIWPWARALFAPFTFHSLRTDVFEGERAAPGIPGGLSISYFLLNAAWRLPEPFWYVAFLTFVPLLPTVTRINALNPAFVVERNSTWKLRHGLLALVSVPLLSFTVASSAGLIPSTQVVAGPMMSRSGLAFLEGAGIVEPDEEILYFYADGFISFAADGNILTDRRVISYWTNPGTSELLIESARLSEIAEVQVFAGDFLTNTVVNVIRQDGTEFQIVLSTEAGGDQLFISRLEALAPQVNLAPATSA